MMGRTKRVRNRRNINQTEYADSETSIVSFNKWLKKNGYEPCCDLRLVYFTMTGRGVCSKTPISVGQVVIKVPFNLIINIVTMASDSIFCDLFFNDNYFVRDSKVHKFKVLEITAFYLTFQKYLKEHSFWFHYIKSLPTTFSVPYFYDSKHLLGEEVKNVVLNQREAILSSFNRFLSIIESCTYHPLRSYKDYFNRSIYEWAYFVVNTRCVYLDKFTIQSLLDSKVFNYNRLLLNSLVDYPALGLIPYLDMFNHSVDAKTKTECAVNLSTKYNKKNTLQSFSSINNVTFNLYSLVNYRPYEQLFISYGESEGLKMLTEYGFYIPKDFIKFTCVHFNFNDFCHYIYENNLYVIDKQKLKFIKDHDFHNNLFVNYIGANFNLKSLLYIVVTKDQKWMTNVYKSSYGKSEDDMNNLLIRISQRKKNELQENLKNVEPYKNKMLDYFHYNYDLLTLLTFGHTLE